MQKQVTPYMGVCIETGLPSCCLPPCHVTPYMGVCIETHSEPRSGSIRRSHPIWVCVLKHIKHHLRQEVKLVTPYMGVCIETDNSPPD